MLDKPVLQFCVALLLIKRMDKKIHHGLPSHRVQHLKECFQQNYIAPRKPCINVATQFLQSEPNKNPLTQAQTTSNLLNSYRALLTPDLNDLTSP